MNYKCSYNNSTFPYNRMNNKKKESQSVDSSTYNSIESNEPENPHVSNMFSNILNSILSPVENALGRKINFDDLLLVALIYLLYTEKDNDNNVLLLCLLFLLF